MARQDTRTFQGPEGGLQRGTRVKLENGELRAAHPGDRHIGVTLQSTIDARTRSTGVSVDGYIETVLADGAIPLGGRVYLADDGKVSASETLWYGLALQAATADGELIEIVKQ